MSQVSTQQNFALRVNAGSKADTDVSGTHGSQQSGAAFNQVLDQVLATEAAPSQLGQPVKLAGDQETQTSVATDLSGAEEVADPTSSELKGAEQVPETGDSQEHGDGGAEHGNPGATEQQLVNYSQFALTQSVHVADSAELPSTEPVILSTGPALQGTESADLSVTVQDADEAVRAPANAVEPARLTAVASSLEVATGVKGAPDVAVPVGTGGAAATNTIAATTGLSGAQKEPAQTEPARTNTVVPGGLPVTGDQGAARIESLKLPVADHSLVAQVPVTRNQDSESAPAQQLVSSVGVVASPAPVAPNSVPPVPAGQQAPDLGQHMANQMRGPLGQLRTAAPGEHVFTISITPENMGPVHVRAHIGGDGVRVELVGATDAVRDQLRTMLTELRRDLQSTGLNAQLGVAQNSSTSGERAGQDNLAGEYRAFKDQQSQSGNSHSTPGQPGLELALGLDQDSEISTNLSTLGAPRVDILA